MAPMVAAEVDEDDEVPGTFTSSDRPLGFRHRLRARHARTLATQRANGCSRLSLRLFLDLVENFDEASKDEAN